MVKDPHTVAVCRSSVFILDTSEPVSRINSANESPLNKEVPSLKKCTFNIFAHLSFWCV